ncbi:hypothetical protein EW146_g7922 [Bondarzewia mesenterica]|uniref:Uncharacterized protein n=1 Tax=Bondarzewia mesenterica TaxID=1095465 RepID=A0A4S4LJ26_9AGAM|nr:hypothetical protein EW146_g7922 [Bondarzewia mesenterica]
MSTILEQGGLSIQISTTPGNMQQGIAAPNMRPNEFNILISFKIGAQACSTPSAQAAVSSAPPQLVSRARQPSFDSSATESDSQAPVFYHGTQSARVVDTDMRPPLISRVREPSPDSSATESDSQALPYYNGPAPAPSPVTQPTVPRNECRTQLSTVTKRTLDASNPAVRHVRQKREGSSSGDAWPANRSRAGTSGNISVKGKVAVDDVDKNGGRAGQRNL